MGTVSEVGNLVFVARRRFVSSSAGAEMRWVCIAGGSICSLIYMARMAESNFGTT